jgi:hypothetical protein
MTTFLPCESLSATLGGLFVCSEHGEYHRIRTPYLYPDGDYIDLFCKTRDETVTVTDLGETTRWLRMQSVSPRRSPKQQAIIDDICQNHNVEFYRGMIVARARPHDDFAAVLTRVAQAALRISDLWFTFRTRSVQSVTDEVADVLSEKELPFERAERILGRSGRTWSVDFHVRAPGRSSLVYVLATGSRSAARAIAEHVLAAWYDLSQLAVGPEALRFVSLFDDTADVWAEEDFKLVEPLSVVTRWSAPEQFLQELQAA